MMPSLWDNYLTWVGDRLRQNNWTPRREYQCGCHPTHLCADHAGQREHYRED